MPQINVGGGIVVVFFSLRQDHAFVESGEPAAARQQRATICSSGDAAVALALCLVPASTALAKKVLLSTKDWGWRNWARTLALLLILELNQYRAAYRSTEN